jgi:N-acetylmuramic acid 6-phosphate etherase
LSETGPTESVNAATRDLDLLGADELVAIFAREQRRAFEAVERSAPQLARAVDAIVERLRGGGALHYVGAGTSGRIAALDAAECPPTFGTPPGMVRAHVAGGDAALARAVEGAEDDAAAGDRLGRAFFGPPDAVVGLSASGGAPFVVAALRAARERGALTIALTCDERAPLLACADIAIVLATGAEPIAGSTRMVAGTAQKLALNALSTAAMVRLGKVYDNLMVDVVASNAKLRRRALRLVMELAPAEEDRARALLAAAAGSVKVAVLVERRGLDPAAARALLAANGDSLRAALG